MEKIKNSLIAGVTELIITHPIDYYKNLVQKNHSSPIKHIIKNPFVGVKPKLIGLVPMRMCFWLGLDYCNKKKYNLLKTSMFMGSTQTLIDYPLEQLKINKMFNSVPKNYLGAFLPHYGRNLIFVYSFLYFKNSTNNPFLGGAIGGVVGSILSQPLDCLKTHYQTGQLKYPQWKLKQYLRGIVPRSCISLIAMSIGYGIITILDLKNK